MKSFLVKGKVPTISWSKVPDGIFFEGNVPQGYSLAINPSAPYIILDVDKHDGKDGFLNIPDSLTKELGDTFGYTTKNNGYHYWMKYTGNKHLMNKSSGLSIDLRTSNGYVVWYKDKDIRYYMDEIKETSKEMNIWLESLFLAGKMKINNK